MIVALFALPALMRFVTPMVGAVASGGGAGAGAAVGAMATGAVSMGRSGSGKRQCRPDTGQHSNQPVRRISEGQQRNSRPVTGQRRPADTRGSTGPGGATERRNRRAAGTTGAGAGAAAGGAGAASGAAKAAGPAGIAVAAGAQAASRVSQAAQQTAQDSTGEGPSGSN